MTDAWRYDHGHASVWIVHHGGRCTTATTRHTTCTRRYARHATARRPQPIPYTRHSRGLWAIFKPPEATVYSVQRVTAHASYIY
eukprot:scaffold6887_cov126-Isochrysis_galbana.AAC.2